MTCTDIESIEILVVSLILAGVCFLVGLSAEHDFKIIDRINKIFKKLQSRQQ